MTTTETVNLAAREVAWALYHAREWSKGNERRGSDCPQRDREIQANYEARLEQALEVYTVEADREQQEIEAANSAAWKAEAHT